MEAVNILHMNSGDGESSYANNSLLQDNVIRKSLPVLEHTIKSMVSHDVIFGQYFKIADLGCSSGPNTLLTASSIMDIVHEACKENNRKTPDFQVCLNDLFGNDFNSTFKSLPNFYAKLKEEKGESFGSCYVSAVPGSFYDRLFPDESLHFVHSSNSVHWLSQVPEGLENNTSHIYMGKKSPQNVFQAYHKQYVTDFTRFLQARSKEIVTGGRPLDQKRKKRKRKYQLFLIIKNFPPNSHTHFPLSYKYSGSDIEAKMSSLSNSSMLLSNTHLSSSSGSSIQKCDKGINRVSIRQSRIGNAQLVASKRTLSIQARYSDDGRSSSGSAFIGGFVLGGLFVGTLGCILAPQISKALAGTDRKELLKKLPNFIYDEEKALEKTRQKLAQKIAELNSAIDDVSSQLKSDDDEPVANGVVPDETEALA